MSSKVEKLQKLAIDSLEDVKALDIRVLDVAEKTTVTDRMIIATGTSSRHNKALLEKVLENTKAAGLTAIGVEGQNISDWMLVDLGDVVVHIMTASTRVYYNLEKLWDTEESADEVSSQESL